MVFFATADQSSTSTCNMPTVELISINIFMVIKAKSFNVEKMKIIRANGPFSRGHQSYTQSLQTHQSAFWDTSNFIPSDCLVFWPFNAYRHNQTNYNYT